MLVTFTCRPYFIGEQVIYQHTGIVRSLYDYLANVSRLLFFFFLVFFGFNFAVVVLSFDIPTARSQ